MTDIKSTAATTELSAEELLTPTQRMLRDAWSRSSFKVGFGIFLALLFGALIYPEISSIDPTKMAVRSRHIPPLFLGEKWTWAHPLGTDHLGRDLLLRCLVGLRYSVMIGICTVILMFSVGCGLGLISGFKGKLTDTIIMRMSDVSTPGISSPRSGAARNTAA